MKSAIKKVLAGVVLAGLMGLLSGCYIAPGYSYVQGNGSAGDVYFGTATPAYSYPYYGYGYGYPYGYGFGYYGYPYPAYYGYPAPAYAPVT